MAGAVWSPEDGQVDNRKLVAALKLACASAGADIQEHRPVRRILVANGRAVGVELADGTEHRGDTVVLAAGAWSRGIEGLPSALRPPVRPVKGQMIALQMDAAAPLVTHAVWGPNVYMAPRIDGRLIVGATVEEKGFDTTITAGAGVALLEAAWRGVPALERLPPPRKWAGPPPRSPGRPPVPRHGPAPGPLF